MQERSVFVDPTTVHRGAIRMLPVLAAVWLRTRALPAPIVCKGLCSPCAHDREASAALVLAMVRMRGQPRNAGQQGLTDQAQAVLAAQFSVQ